MEYNKKVGAGRKFVEGIALSFEIMVLFVMLQVILTVAVMLALISAYVVMRAGSTIIMARCCSSPVCCQRIISWSCSPL